MGLFHLLSHYTPLAQPKSVLWSVALLGERLLSGRADPRRVGPVFLWRASGNGLSPGLPQEPVLGWIHRLVENSDQAGRAPRWRLLEAR
jgi:hypothetical protein